MHELILFDFKSNNQNENNYNKSNNNIDNRNKNYKDYSNKNNANNKADINQKNLLHYIKIKFRDMYQYISIFLNKLFKLLNNLSLKKNNINSIHHKSIFIKINDEINIVIFKICCTLDDFKKLDTAKTRIILDELINSLTNESEHEENNEILRYIYIYPQISEVEFMIKQHIEEKSNIMIINYNTLKEFDEAIYFCLIEKICRSMCRKQSLSLEKANVAVVLDPSHSPDIIPEKILTMLKSLNLVIEEKESNDIECFCTKCMEELGLCVSVHKDIKTIERDCDIIINFAFAQRFKNFMPASPKVSIINISKDKTLRIKTANIIVNGLIFFLPNEIKTQLHKNTSLLTICDEGDISLLLIYIALVKKESINQNKIMKVVESLKITYMLDAKIGYVKKKISC